MTLQRRAPMKRTPMKRSATPMRRTQMKRKPSKSKAEFPPDVREAVARRSLGHCEAQTEVCWGTATMIHHIRRRSQGGTGTFENALHVCAPCHDWIHLHPATSRERGWLEGIDAG